MLVERIQELITRENHASTLRVIGCSWPFPHVWSILRECLSPNSRVLSCILLFSEEACSTTSPGKQIVCGLQMIPGPALFFYNASSADFFLGIGSLQMGACNACTNFFRGSPRTQYCSNLVIRSGRTCQPEYMQSHNKQFYISIQRQRSQRLGKLHRILASMERLSCIQRLYKMWDMLSLLGILIWPRTLFPQCVSHHIFALQSHVHDVSFDHEIDHPLTGAFDRSGTLEWKTTRCSGGITNLHNCHRISTWARPRRPQSTRFRICELMEEASMNTGRSLRIYQTTMFSSLYTEISNWKWI